MYQLLYGDQDVLDIIQQHESTIDKYEQDAENKVKAFTEEENKKLNTINKLNSDYLKTKHIIQQNVKDYKNQVDEECDRQCNILRIKMITLIVDYINSKVMPVLKKNLNDILASIKSTDNDEIFEQLYICIDDLKDCE